MPQPGTRDNSKILIVAGPTAVGKSAFLLLLADSLERSGRGIEVISADAFQAYRGLDIGTAKPDAEFLSRVPHHLIDIRDPDQSYNVGDFVTGALAAAEEIRGRGNTPVLCGGTAYYIRHLMLGVPEAPPSDPVIRQNLVSATDTFGLAHMYQELGKVDPDSAKRIHPNDSYRILRALEVFHTSGRPLSSFRKEAPGREGQTKNDGSGMVNATVPFAEGFNLIVLDRERQVLRDRIAARVREMFVKGLSLEVAALVSRGFGPNDPGMRAIGYNEFFDEHSGIRTDLASVENEIVVHTRQYAKRQLTFFRSLPFTLWKDAGQQDLVAEVEALYRG